MTIKNFSDDIFINHIVNNIVIYNKVGLAYGQLSDVAYIKNKNISIILTATIDVNTNKIYNDDKYYYDSIGFPFLADISRVIINRLSEEPEILIFLSQKDSQ